ncbi:aminoglycoside phosphotransferase family protein [Kribbella amoyensis]|uniref:aminoglycoside phosphotransferase family protein n=1 Tax=Kribbella amoyensis TaxID=996641 RepID=UPI0011AB2427|nr:aminoglycoside phosphotransferase family protein [Kribbella amoyensis]
MIELPASFLAMPRWWSEGHEWLTGLPAAVEAQCDFWGLRADGDVLHGSNAIVLPVLRDGVRLALRMSPPGAEVEDQARALRWWAGRGVVELVDAQPDHGALLLERLGEPLTEQPLDEVLGVLGQLIRRLAVAPDPESRSTADIARVRGVQLGPEYERLGRPFDPAYLRAAERIADELSTAVTDLAVNGDFHADQVLRGGREPWLMVDPVLYRGEIEYDLARVLWTNVDAMPTGGAILEHFGTVVETAGLDRDRARAWVVYRTVDYWLWGLSAGLTEDPVRCARLLGTFL